MDNELPDSRHVVRDALRLHHLDWGNEGRHPVVLVHGSRLHAHVWNDFARRFRERYHIIAVDQRGHGESDWDAASDYRLEELYGDLRAVVQARGLTRYTLIGHSLGGRVSMLYAHRHHAEIERLVLVDITPGRASVPAPAAPGPQPAREFDTPEAAIAYLARAMSRAPARLVEESVRRGMRTNDAGRYIWKYDPLLATRRVSLPPGMDLWRLMAEVPTPTLLQYGSHSDVVNAELAERLRAAMPCCSVERIEGAGHGLFTDQPDAFAASVAGFIDRA